MKVFIKQESFDVDQFQKDKGREFNSLGLITLTDSPPFVKYLKAATTKKPTSENLRVQVWGRRRSDMLDQGSLIKIQ